MATTDMLRGNSLSQTQWAVKGFVDMYKHTSFGQMFDRGVIFQADELNGAKTGDQVTFNFTGILTGTGIGEGGTLVGNEEALDLQSDSMVINTFRHAVNNPDDDNTIEGQRSRVPFEERARKLLPQFMGSRLDASIFNQLAGVNTTNITVDGTTYSGTNRTFVQGLNATTAPTTNRITRAGGAATDQALTSTDTFNLDLIDDAIEAMTGVYPTVEKLDNEMFDLYCSPGQIRDLKRDTTGKIQWYTNYTSELQGGNIGDNPIKQNSYYKKPVGEYCGVRIYSSSRVATGQNSSTSAAISTVSRAVLVGRNALAFGSKFGSLAGGNVPLKFFTQMQDYDYYKGIEARMIYGLVKLVFDSEDYGVHVISTYAA